MIDDFEALLALSEAGTMTRAATRLGITQPAVSRRIQNLEHRLGKKLVEGSKRNPRLSEYAKSS